MYPLPQVVTELTTAFASLPGLGKKTAQRLVQHLLTQVPEKVTSFGMLLENLHEQVAFCTACYALMDPGHTLCPLCCDATRQHDVICVVETFLDVIAIEETGVYRGLYHVLQGVLSPLDGVGPEQLKMKELRQRLSDHAHIKEIILATNPTMEGETTALYIKNLLKDYDLIYSRIAKGMPMGGSIDYADGLTLGNALEKRVIY